MTNSRWVGRTCRGGGGAQVYVCGLLTSRNGYTATNASEGSIAVSLEINNLQSR